MLDMLEYNGITEALSGEPVKLVLSSLRNKTHLYRKTVIRKMLIKGNTVYQMEQFTDTQVFHENILAEQLEETVLKRFPHIYSQLNIFYEDSQWDFKMTKKGKLLRNKQERTGKLQKRTQAAQTEDKRIVPQGETQFFHDRKKNYLLEEGKVIPPLVDLGIFTKEGRVARNMYDKYKQINRFLELVEDVVKDYPKKELHIIDFGCGKSYLTFILYYYLAELKGYAVHMTGLDLKEDVIRKCNETARKYHYGNLHFELGDINGYQAEEPIDMVVTLHACDTATDYALYNAITWKAGIILSVPCCQHELNRQIKSDDFSLLTKYGIVKERVAALMTDAIRANILEYCGYKTQLLEFIDIAHSPKNLLIRAVKGNVSGKRRQKAEEEIGKLCKEFQTEQTLVELVMKSGKEQNICQ